MRQIVITRSGGIDVLQITERPDPTPAPGEALIRVRAAGINFADILARQGLYPDAPKLPAVVGYEVAGTVEAVGADTDAALVGKAVMALTRFGGYAEVVTVPLIQVFEKPEALSFEQAAAIPVNYMTAYGLLTVMGGLSRGEAVLIHNAGGGVGLAALDLARHIGATTYGTASRGKHEFLKSRGLDHAIDYRNQDWLAEVKRLTDGRGVELVIDPIGGKSWKLSYKALRSTGRLGVFGVSVGSSEGLAGKLGMLKAVMQMPRFHPLGLMGRNKGVFGLNLGHLWHEREKIAAWMAVIVGGVRDGWVRPYVDRAFPFAQAGAAHAYIEARHNLGKVVLTP
ncbi:MAG TPA: medium chain dehydrogenase/reductase family protein [Blastocatellia bacterium]|nr:medium chain dehydrogenase/reductase family protein [Blastocatellia bacterium]